MGPTNSTSSVAGRLGMATSKDLYSVDQKQPNAIIIPTNRPTSMLRFRDEACTEFTLHNRSIVQWSCIDLCHCLLFWPANRESNCLEGSPLGPPAFRQCSP